MHWWNESGSVNKNKLEIKYLYLHPVSACLCLTLHDQISKNIIKLFTHGL